MPGKFGYCNNKNVRSGGEANGGSLRMIRNGCRIERDLGGRESSILKQDERKKLLRDMHPPTFRPPLSAINIIPKTPKKMISGSVYSRKNTSWARPPALENYLNDMKRCRTSLRAATSDGDTDLKWFGMTLWALQGSWTCRNHRNIDGWSQVGFFDGNLSARGFLEGQNWQLASQPVLRSFQRRHRRSYRGSWERRLMSHKE